MPVHRQCITDYFLQLLWTTTHDVLGKRELVCSRAGNNSAQVNQALAFDPRGVRGVGGLHVRGGLLSDRGFLL